MPSNDEQWRIVERLERHRSVVVQGPPGTGKSHTIANLISHLAAVGKRVLVTSHTGRALEVLKGKLPPDVAKLCVSVVGDDRQISPDNVGLDRRVVERFQSQYLPDIELRDLLGLDNSLFDQAASRYRGRIWLQEHFRCMPEIIQFSSRLSYGDHPWCRCASSAPTGWSRSRACTSGTPGCGRASRARSTRRRRRRSSSGSPSAAPTLGGKGSEQRFNVAASRAQDQLWLFHSVELHDLNPECVRWKLLSHFLNPPAALEVLGEVHPEILQEPFDSLFEQQVYLRLRERGHTVVPQHRVHGFRIDLVVLGEHSRLAVECDGDEWHGPEQYARDMAHQRDLERCGWRFFRLRASEFYRDPDAPLEPLWTLLHERGIAPARAL